MREEASVGSQGSKIRRRRGKWRGLGGEEVGFEGGAKGSEAC